MVTSYLRYIIDPYKVAFELAEKTRCILSFERSFLRPVFK